MDDPWGNAWASTSATASVPADDPWKPAPVTSELTVSDTAPTWEPPAWPSDTFDDDSAAIWNTGAQTPTDDAAVSEPAVDIEPEVEPVAETQTEVEIEVKAEVEVEELEPRSPPPEVPAIITSASPPQDDVQLPGSPEGDGFGMFETAVVDDTAPIDNAWAGTDSGTPLDINSSRGVAAETPLDGARGLWGPGPESAVEGGDEHDEWAQASARQRLEEERERRFPREIVNTVLESWEELANELYPKPKTTDGEQEPVDSAAAVFEARLEAIPGIPDLITSLVPDYSLQPVIPFAKTATFTALRTSLRATKHYAVVQQGPLAQFYNSKGASAWESSVRATPSVRAEDDDWPFSKPAPEPAKTAPTAQQSSTPAKPGILGGLWGRRPSSQPPAPQSQEPSTSAAGSRTASPRPSIDSTRSSTPSQVGKDIPALVFPSVSSTLPSPTVAESGTAQVSPSTPTAAPSAVSRFLGRFSRKSSTSTPPPTSDVDKALTLSSDDFSFLSDVGPSSGNSPMSPEDDFLSHLSSPSAGALMSSKLPPALAPPPRSTLPVAATRSMPADVLFADDDDDDDEQFSSMQQGAASSAVLDAVLGGGMGASSFDQGYAPLSSSRARGQVQKSRSQPAPALPPPPSGPVSPPGGARAVLPSSLVERERRAAAVSARIEAQRQQQHTQQSPVPSILSPSSPAPRPPPKAAPPPNPMFAGDDFENFLAGSSSMNGRGTAPAAPVAPTPAAADDDEFGDFGDFMSPPTSPPPPKPQLPPPPVQQPFGVLPPTQQSFALPPAPPSFATPPMSRPPSVSYGRPTAVPSPPVSRTPVAVMRSSSAHSQSPRGTPPPLLPPPGSSKTPAVVMTRASSISTGQSSGSAPLLAPPPGSVKRTSGSTVDLLADPPPPPKPSNPLADLMADVSVAPALTQTQMPVSPTGRTHAYGASPPLPPLPSISSTSSFSFFDAANQPPAGAKTNGHAPAATADSNIDAAWGFDEAPALPAPGPSTRRGGESAFDWDLFDSPAARTSAPPVHSPPPVSSQSRALSPPLKSFSPPPLAVSPPPAPAAATDMSFSLFGNAAAAAPPPAPPTSAGGKKGLSAADLSFFEGL